MRRLITLISAGRNRTIVIRRELPRTRDASWVNRPYRIKRRRVLLSVSPSTATATASKASMVSFSSGLPLGLCFDLYGHTGMVVVVEHGKNSSSELIERTNAIGKQWIDYWATVTGHRSSMTTNPR